jgi:hypothetical protein
MPRSLTERARKKFERISNVRDFEDSVKRELDELSKLTDDIALVVVGHLYIEKNCLDVLTAFFNYNPARNRLDTLNYSSIINLLRLTNLCDEKILDALDFLGTLRNRFAHDLVSLTLLDRAAAGRDRDLADKFHATCKGFKAEGGSIKDRFIELLKRIHVDLRKSRFVAQEMDRYINSSDFIESLEDIKIL